ncbi:hypothetical protein ACF09H_11960, partial [Streptomyces sp. NPDC014983]
GRCHGRPLRAADGHAALNGQVPYEAPFGARCPPSLRSAALAVLALSTLPPLLAADATGDLFGLLTGTLH